MLLQRIGRQEHGRLTADSSSSAANATCDTVQEGYQCANNISHYWGQYSPYFSVPSEIPTELPEQCSITFAQILARHGARDPTTSKTTSYNATIAKIHSHVKNYTGIYAFLKDYEYTLGANDLTVFGQQEMINSGMKYYGRYKHLAEELTPFVRTSSEARVVESAQNWTQGFHEAKLADPNYHGNDFAYPYPMVVILEADYGSNNTLNHDLCTQFENGTDSNIADDAQAIFADVFIPPIQARLNAGLPGANLTQTDTISMMDLCSFNTVASPVGQISAFCALFTVTEWHEYNYYETLGKYYGFSYGNPLGPTQGVGFSNELIARLTNKPVQDETSTNHTLDDNPATFPLGRKLYADFSHDNDITGILSALGLYNNTTPMLSNTTVMTTSQTNGYSAAWTVPYSARVYFEKMQCKGEASHHGKDDEELIRIIVNDRVLPLSQCGGDHLGRCTLDAFIGSLGFPKMNGDWDQCFT